MKLYEIEPYAMGFMNADREDLEYRVASGIKAYAEYVELTIVPSEWFVGCSPFYRAPDYGAACGALPNGKRMHDTNLADGIGAVPGCDINGPTALQNSVLKGNQYLATSGNVMQVKFLKEQFQTETGKESFIALAKTYFKLGGQTLQINVVSPADLLDAVENPKKHENLIVRVGGYSAYFTKLQPDMQKNIIRRSLNIM